MCEGKAAGNIGNGLLEGVVSSIGRIVGADQENTTSFSIFRSPQKTASDVHAPVERGSSGSSDDSFVEASYSMGEEPQTVRLEDFLGDHDPERDIYTNHDQREVDGSSSDTDNVKPINILSSAAETFVGTLGKLLGASRDNNKNEEMFPNFRSK
jgi:hypothetical protein